MEVGENSKKKHIIILAILFILIPGLYLTWFTWHLTAEKLSKNALEQTRLVAESINTQRLAKLKGNPEDLRSEDYERIKQQLFQIRKAHSTCRFLYLMGQKSDGTVFFFLDSQPETSTDYAPPGLIYEEVSEEYLLTFKTGHQQTVGPVTDRWGTLVTSLVPLYYPGTRKIIAILGMDTEADDWTREIISQCMLPLGLTSFIVLLMLFIFMLHQSRARIRVQYQQKTKLTAELEEALAQIKKLQGLLPICAKCMKIRDDKGYWNQIDIYLSQHSDIQFSHGLCPTCQDTLYGKHNWYKKRQTISKPSDEK